MYVYMVRCHFDDPTLVDRCLAWLGKVHIPEVCAAGAMDVEVIMLDRDADQSAIIEVRYRFESRRAVEVYERDYALWMGKEEPGLYYSGRSGEILSSFSVRS